MLNPARQTALVPRGAGSAQAESPESYICADGGFTSLSSENQPPLQSGNSKRKVYS